MANPSVSMPDEMEDEIKERREKGESRSEYIRGAIQRRFELEDAGEWDDEDVAEQSIK